MSINCVWIPYQKGDDDRDFEGAVVLKEVEGVAVKRCFWDLHESCCVKCREVPSTITEAEKLAHELFNQVGGSEAQVANDSAPVTPSGVETEAVSLSTNSEKAHEDAASAKVELDGHFATAEIATKVHNVALEKAREERQEEADAQKATILWSEVTFAKARDKKSVEESELHYKFDSATARQQELLVSIRNVVKVLEERKD